MKKILKFVKNVLPDSVFSNAASLAFYAMFALAPFLIIMASLGNAFADESFVRERVTFYVVEKFGSDAQVFVDGVFHELSAMGQNNILTIVSIVILFFGIIRFFEYAREVFFQIFEYKVREKDPLKKAIKIHGMSLFYMVVVVLLFFALSVFNVLVSFLSRYSYNFFWYLPEQFYSLTQFAIGFVGLSLIFSALYRIVSVYTVDWKGAIIGGFTASFLVNIVNFLLVIFLAWGTNVSIYGTAGFFLATLLWIYYSIVSVFIGAETAKYFD